MDQASGAATAIHRLVTATAENDHSIRLSLTGEAPPEYAPYFDLFYLERSTNFTDWSLFDSAVRTNTSAAQPSFVEPSSEDQAFFRSPTNITVTPFTPPTGPEQVGTVSRLLTSSIRKTNKIGVTRQFMVSVFYPAAPAPWHAPKPIFEPLWGTVLFSKEFLYVQRPANVPTNLVGHAIEDQPLKAGTNTFPALIYCHGGQYFRRDNLAKLTDLASHGYVVIAADYYDAWFSFLPDGTVSLYDPQTDFAHTTLNGAVHDASMGDTRFLLDELARMNESDPIFAKRLDLSRIGAFGWSFGGAVAADICRADERVKCALLYDNAFWACPEVTRLGLNKPFLCINSTQSPTPDWATPGSNLVARATQDALFFQIQNARHRDFSDMILIDEPNPTERSWAKLISDYGLAFFNHFLLGTKEPLLDAPPTDGPVIVNWTKK